MRADLLNGEQVVVAGNLVQDDEALSLARSPDGDPAVVAVDLGVGDQLGSPSGI
jgi:hypothetical protein